MCYSGTCPHELWPSGECGKRRGQVCPDDVEPDELEAMEEVAREAEELRAETEWDRRNEGDWP